MWRKGNPYSLLVAVQISTTIVEISLEVPQNVLNMIVVTKNGI